MEDKFKSAYEKFITLWGEDSQIDMCIEEMSELTKELCKYRRIKKFCNTTEKEEKLKKARENILEEIADVLNMTEQMEYIFDDKNEIDIIREEKINRTLKRL